MRKMNLLGIELVDYTLKEALKLSGNYLNSGALNTIVYLSTKRLVEIGADPEQKKWLEVMDMTICGDSDILRAAKIENKARIKEVETDQYFKEFIQRYIKNKRKVILISNNIEQLEDLKSLLLFYRHDLNVVGQHILTEDEGEEETLINEINQEAPSVIISRLPHALQESFLYRNKQKINGNVWLGLLITGGKHSYKNRKSTRLMNWFYKKLFSRKVSRFQNDEVE